MLAVTQIEQLKQLVFQEQNREYPSVTNMAQAVCVKEVLRLAALVDHRYQRFFLQVQNQKWDNWRQVITQDVLRESFLSWGGHLVTRGLPGDLLFIRLRFAPVDHVGLLLDDDLFLHYAAGKLCLEKLAAFTVISWGRV